MSKQRKHVGTIGIFVLVVGAVLVDPGASFGALGPRLYVEPIEGLTTIRHRAPAEITVPVGVTIRFSETGLRGEEVTWTGAHEIERVRDRSTAECPLHEVGPQVIRAVVTAFDGRRIEHISRINVVDVRANQIRLGRIQARVKEFDLDESATNEQTMEWYFGSSIASLTRIGKGQALIDRGERSERKAGRVPRYRTSASRAVTFSVEVYPQVFASMMEWDVSGPGKTLAREVISVFDTPGEHFVTVGPPGRQRRIEIESYSVAITSHESFVDIVPEGRLITFEAVTDPPGFEDQITWLSSTKYGQATPVLGYGPTFTVQFDETFGDDPEIGLFQWLGVKADNVVFSQDQKAGACCLNEIDGCVAAAGDCPIRS